MYIYLLIRDIFFIKMHMNILNHTAAYQADFLDSEAMFV